MSIQLPEADHELIRGVCELHVHAMPCVFDRPFDELELAKQARDVGYRAILFKCHHAINADRAIALRKLVPGIEVFGGVVLNRAVGGLNPDAVEAAISFGAKEVWMPTLHAANHIKKIGVADYPKHRRAKELPKKPRKVEGITILSPRGEVVPQVHEILGMIADANVILGTSHLSVEEDFALIEAAKEAGVEKILVTHPAWEAVSLSIEDQEKMAEMGAVLEHCLNPCMPFGQRYDPKLIADAIKRAGAEHCIMATDFGQWYNPHPIEGMRLFMRLMMRYDISRKEIDLMTKGNPAKLLGLSLP